MDTEIQRSTPNINIELDGLRKDERLRVQEKCRDELSWWEDRLIEDVPEALQKGILKEVPQEGTRYRLIMTLRNNKEPKLLNSQALDLLGLVGQKWKDKLINIPTHDVIFLSVTSLYRSRKLQEELLRNGANASTRSAHQAGAAIDFDPNGYYKGSERVSVKRGDGIFDERYILILKEVLEELEKEGKCQVIWEKSYKVVDEAVLEYDSCYHVCAKPTVLNHGQ